MQWQPTGDLRGRLKWPKDELAVGIALCAAAGLTMNLSALAVSLSLVCGAVAVKFGWEAKGVRALAVASFALLMLHLALSLLLSASPMLGARPLVFSIHF